MVEHATRAGSVRSIVMLRVRPPLTLRASPSGRAFPCAAPARRDRDPFEPTPGCGVKARWCYRIERLIVPLCLTHAKAGKTTGAKTADRAPPSAPPTEEAAAPWEDGNEPEDLPF